MAVEDRTCVVCSERVDIDDRARQTGIVGPDGEPSIGWVHAECMALGIVGHEFGVCSCTGYDTTSRKAARELWARLKKHAAADSGVQPRKDVNDD